MSYDGVAFVGGKIDPTTNGMTMAFTVQGYGVFRSSNLRSFNVLFPSPGIHDVNNFYR